VEEVGGFFDGGAGSRDPLLEIGTLVGALIDGFTEDVEGHVRQLLGNRFQPGANLGEVCGHQRTASSIRVSGWRTSRPALRR
jgi:hypothetical protein